MVASSRLAGIRSPGRKSPACTSERSWSRSWMYSGTWLSGWRCSGNIVSHPKPILHEIGLLQEPICLLRGRVCFRRNRGVQSSLAGGFAGGKLVEAQARGVRRIALINLYERKVGVPHLVRATFHARGVIGRIGGQGTSLPCANAKLAGGRFVVGIRKAAADARAVDEMTDELDAGVFGSPNGGDNARSVRETGEQFFCIGFHAIEGVCILK